MPASGHPYGSLALAWRVCQVWPCPVLSPVRHPEGRIPRVPLSYTELAAIVTTLMFKRPARLLVWPLLFLLVTGLSGLYPISGGADSGSVVRYARVKTVGGVYVLNANIKLVLTDVARDALLSGVPLVFELEMAIVRPRKWWPDEEVADMDQKFKLSYHALSRQFLVQNLNTGIQETYSRLVDALERIGELRDFPLIDATLLDPGQHYFLELRVRLDIERLPFPLMVQGYLSGDWRIDSGSHRIPIR